MSARLLAPALVIVFSAACGSDEPSGTPPPPICGNGEVEANEACDDGGESATCDADCTAVTCGDGEVNATAGEDCDDQGESATCDADCTAVVCGDEIINTTAGEVCDDGGSGTGDGCDDSCVVESGWQCTGMPSICSETSWVRPADTVEVGFSIDDSANQTYTAADGLAWKGSLSFDATARILSYDGAWGGPFVLLWDDGPWDAGGHEPAGATAGDHIWSAAVFVEISSSPITIEYGAIRGSMDGSDGQWIWTGANSTVTIPAGASTPITATGMTIPAFGTIDLRLTLDTNNLDSGYSFNPGTDSITVKGSAWAWVEVPIIDDGTGGDETASDGIYTFVMSANVGPGTDRPHTGLLRSGDAPEFVFVIDGIEYKGSDPTAGVSAAISDGSWAPVTVEVNAYDTSYVNVP